MLLSGNNMPALHLYNPTYLNTIGSEVTFNLYVSSVNYSVPEKDSFYYGYLTGITGVQTYTLSYAPLSADTLTLEMTYLSGATSVVLDLVNVGLGDYNGVEYNVLTDAGAAQTPSPTAYLDSESGKLIVLATDDTYSIAYSAGPTAIIANAGYVIPELFVEDFYANDVTIDFGDGTVTTYEYNGSKADTFTHTYSTAGEYTINATAQFITGAFTPASTFSRTFTTAIDIDAVIETVDKDVNRVNGSSVVNLPYPQAQIPVNEWIDYQSINQVFGQLYDNYEYAVDSTTIYQVGPLQYYGWGAVTETQPGRGTINWHSNNFNSAAIQSLTSYNDITDIWALNNDSYDNLYIGTTDRVEKYDYNLSERTVQADTAASIETRTPTRITSIATDSRDRIYLLDAQRLLVKAYAFNPTIDDYAPIFEWGGLGGVTGNTKFYKPNDLFIANDKVFVVDSGNNCVKRFTLGGQWEYTYTSDNMSGGDIDDNAPISATLDIDNNLFVTTKTGIIKFTYDGTEVFATDIQMRTSTPVCIRHHNGFVYILTQDDVIRVFTNGETTNTFATRALISSELNAYTKLHIDVHGNLYITDGTIILKYIDSPILLDATPRTNDRVWAFDDIKIKPDEFVSALTYNKFFARMYDNLNILFHTIEGKVIRNSDNSLSLVSLSNCDIGAFEGLPIYKEEIYIGLNELVTPEVINRCVSQILILEQYILDIIMNKYSGCITGEVESFRIETPVLPDCCWSWDARRTALCCLTWDRLSGLTTTWQQATGCCVTI